MSKDQLAAGQASPASDCSGTIKQTIYPHGGSRIWMEYPDGTVELMADTYDGEDLAKKVRATIEAHFFPNITPYRQEEMTFTVGRITDLGPCDTRKSKLPPASSCTSGGAGSTDVGGDFYNGIEWLACWLLDHAERETITEEQLRPWAVKAWQEHLKRLNPRSSSQTTRRASSE